MIILPNLKSVNLNDSSLTYTCQTWRLPRSNTQVPIISFQGFIDSKPSLIKETYFIRWRIDELESVLTSSHGLMIDLRHLLFEENLNLEEFSSIISNLEEPIRIIVQPDTLDRLSNMFGNNKTLVDYKKAFSEIAFELKKYRFDKGLSINAPREPENISLSPVSLEISALTLTCYTWKFEDDSLTSGYISIKGRYRYGSAGSEDAMFINWRSNQFCEVFQPKRLLIDLREFSYEWGDDLNLYPFHFISPENPIRFLLSRQQIPCFETIIYGRNMLTNEEEILSELERI